MRRRSISRQNTEIELFPFLSILACTIGTLILLIIVLTTQALNKQEVTIVARTEGENGVNKSKTPRYIECKSDGIVIYPGEEFIPQNRLDIPNSGLTKLIAQMKKNRDREYLIVAVRANGIDTFNLVRNLIEGADIDIGYEPIDANWQLKIQESTEN